MQALFAFGRVASSTAVGLLLCAGFVRRGLGPGDAALASLPFVVAAAAGGMLNDYHDRHRDSLDKPWRAIPAGYVRPRSALLLAALLILVAATASVAADYSVVQRAIFWAALAGVSSYHIVVARASVLKAPFIGALSASPVACVLHGTPVPAFAPIVATATFVCGRELLMDVLDIAGDAATGSRTVAVRFGASTGAGLGFSLVLAGAWLFHVSAGYGLRDGGRWQGVLAAAVLGASLALWVSRPSRRRLVIYLMWIVLASGISSVLVLLQQDRAR